MKTRINRYDILVFLCLIYGFFRSQIDTLGATRYYGFVVLFAIVWTVVRSYRGKGLGIEVSVPLIRMQLPWMIFMLLTFRNVEIMRGFAFSETNFRIYLCFAMMFLLPYSGSWEGKFRKTMLCMGLIYVACTFLIYLIPSLFSYVIDFYGSVPIGTGGGTYGYRAGIADHYSQNGIYISLALISSGIAWLTATERKNKALSLILTVISAFALILTAKRGVLIFSAAALIAAFILSDREHKLLRTAKVAAAGIAVLAVFVILSPYVPAFSAILDRFRTMGTDGSSEERLSLWNLAVNQFYSSPIIGIGFWGFKFAYAEEVFPSLATASTTAYLNAHNVYIQVLCEMGIVGLCVYILCIVGTLVVTMKTLAASKENAQTQVLLLSLCIQVFFILYSFTGNCLYDIVFIFYAIAAAVAYRHQYLCIKSKTNFPQH